MMNNRQHAIVIGASINGLMTARVLARYFKQVTIIEKDSVYDFPESRKGQPHTRHVHSLLTEGLNIMSTYYAGLKEELVRNGAIEMDIAYGFNWYSNGGFKRRFVFGINTITMSRLLLEYLIKKRTMSIPNIQLNDNNAIKEIIASADNKKITGIKTENKKTGLSSSIDSDLIVDTTGRGSRAVQWLKQLNYKVPEQSMVNVDVCYNTRIYKRDPMDPRGNSRIIFSPNAPNEKILVIIFPIENDRWILSLCGWHGTIPPIEETEFLSFLKQLPHPDIYDIVKTSTPISEFTQYKFPYSLRKHYEKLKDFPVGFVVLGDAVASYNPVYGHGMTSGAFQVKELEKVLQENISEKKMARVFFKRITKIIDRCWQSSTGEDFRYPETTGNKPLGIKYKNKYVSLLHRRSIKDEKIYAAFLKVTGLIEKPRTLFYPSILWRLLTTKK